MDRRHFQLRLALAAGAAFPVPALAQGLAGISSQDAARGLKAALERGAEAAVQLLGKSDGFLGNPKVRIPLPGYLKDAEKFLRALGRGQQVDELVVGINRAAEQSVPLALDLLKSAVRAMSVQDAKKILTGGDTSVTEFFAEKTRAPLGDKFMPVVARTMERIKLADKYNQVAGKGASLGIVRQEDADITRYVTRRTLDGLYLVIGDEERKIRQDPIGTGSALLSKVFGALR